jgi:hypothetical protein
MSKLSTDANFLSNMLEDLISGSSHSSSIAHTLKQVFEASKQDVFAKHLKVFIVKKACKSTLTAI